MNDELKLEIKKIIRDELEEAFKDPSKLLKWIYEDREMILSHDKTLKDIKNSLDQVVNRIKTADDHFQTSVADVHNKVSDIKEIVKETAEVVTGGDN